MTPILSFAVRNAARIARALNGLQAALHAAGDLKLEGAQLAALLDKAVAENRDVTAEEVAEVVLQVQANLDGLAAEIAERRASAAASAAVPIARRVMQSPPDA